MGHGFSRQITEKCGTKTWKWELYFGTPKIEMGTIFWDGGSIILLLFGGRREKINVIKIDEIWVWENKWRILWDRGSN